MKVACHSFGSAADTCPVDNLGHSNTPPSPASGLRVLPWPTDIAALVLISLLCRMAFLEARSNSVGHLTVSVTNHSRFPIPKVQLDWSVHASQTEAEIEPPGNRAPPASAAAFSILVSLRTKACVHGHLNYLHAYVGCQFDTGVL